MNRVFRDKLGRKIADRLHHLQPLPSHQQPQVERDVTTALYKRQRPPLDLRFERYGVVKQLHAMVVRTILSKPGRRQTNLRKDRGPGIIAMKLAELPLSR